MRRRRAPPPLAPPSRAASPLPLPTHAAVRYEAEDGAATHALGMQRTGTTATQGGGHGGDAPIILHVKHQTDTAASAAGASVDVSKFNYQPTPSLGTLSWTAKFRDASVPKGN
ncbi:hypothetical protein VPH35_103978 [Triticum aestivum]|uniref:Uncharacterized protein n=2 Tax=Triticum TaxID=4564 RepID=A0A9R0XXD4_TRITD|nr:unnamed protein product [Triticum turgidum subsp. durum]